MRLPVLLTLAVVANGGAAAVKAEPTPAVRTEVPVREVVLSNGTRRYAVLITVGATAIEAGLDTGSSGLRLVPGAVPETDARPTGRSDTYSYGAGAKLDGVVGEAQVAVGGHCQPKRTGAGFAAARLRHGDSSYRSVLQNKERRRDEKAISLSHEAVRASIWL